MITLLNTAKLANLKCLAQSMYDVPGAAAECGVFQGGSLQAIAEALPDKKVYGFDTFSGLPEQHWTPDEKHKPGDFSFTSFERVKRAMAGHRNVVLVPGVFPGTALDMSCLRFAFVHVDFDFYIGTRKAIRWFRRRMSRGGIMLFDDYEWKWCPGVKRAIDESGLTAKPTQSNQAVVQF